MNCYGYNALHRGCPVFTTQQTVSHTNLIAIPIMSKMSSTNRLRRRLQQPHYVGFY